MTELKIATPRVFIPLLQPGRYKGAYGGRGSGKSHFFAEYIISSCIQRQKSRWVGIREVQKSLKESVKLLLEDKIDSLGVGHLFSPKSERIDTPGGGVILFQGMQDHTKESIKSLEGFSAYVEEAQTLTEGSWEMLRPTIRAPGAEILASWNPRHASDPIDGFFRGPVQHPDALVVRANHADNPFFPDALEQERLFDMEHSRDRYSHIWEGDYEPQAIGAIWDRLMLHQGRRDSAPPLTRILVSVDHAVSNTVRSDEHGIVVVGLGQDGRGYVLDDATTRGEPHKWASRAIAMYDAYEADSIVIEENQGGDLVESNIRAVWREAPIIRVRATRGKHVRADPIASLYRMGRISHVGAFPELEDQMCLFTRHGYEGDDSPDRVCALVWGLTQLFPQMTTKVEEPKDDDYWDDPRHGIGRSVIGGY